jgi:hypothetical protein
MPNIPKTLPACFLDRLPMLVEIRSENNHRKVVRSNAEDPEKDRRGGASSMYQIDLRFFGIADYLLKGDIGSFRRQLSESAQIMLSLFDRHDAGEPISDSYVAMISYQGLFDALAAGDMNTAKALAEKMGGRDKLEREHDHPFDYAMGYALKYMTLDTEPQMESWIPKLEEACRETRPMDFIGYPQLYQSILNHDVASADAALKEIVKGHKKQSKGRGVFAGIEDEALSVWGVGAANLARFNGLAVKGIEPLIPNDLLIPVE